MISAPRLLRAGLLDGKAVLVAGADATAAGHQAVADAVESACEPLGGRVAKLELGAGAGEEVDEAAVERSLREALGDGVRPDVLVIDAAGLFLLTGAGRAGLRACLELGWAVTHAVVAECFLPREGQPGGGRVVYVAPAAGAGEHALAAAAGLENLARTLSIEWARHGITTVAIAPGEGTSPDELAALCAYLASPAGAYFSGCLLDLTGP